MHVLSDPLQAYACRLPDCDERLNEICQRMTGQCVNATTGLSQWSDGESESESIEYNMDNLDPIRT